MKDLELEKAKELLENAAKIEKEKVAKEINDFLQDVEKRTGYVLQPVGRFEGNKMQCFINIVKLG